MAGIFEAIMPDVMLPNANSSQLFSDATIIYPLYHVTRPDIIAGFSDRYLSLVAPVICYWGYSAFFLFIDYFDLFSKYRIYESEEVTRRNKVTLPQVLRAVFIQHIFQTILGYSVLEDEIYVSAGEHVSRLNNTANNLSAVLQSIIGNDLSLNIMRNFGKQMAWWVYWWGIPIAQFLFATFILDTWQYWFHRFFHMNKFLYRNVHSVHHRLYCPYGFGALYNHPLEGFVLDTCGTAFAHFISLMSTRQAIVLFSVSTLKTVDDHCGYSLPFDPFQVFFINNAPYHDAHHQIKGLKNNFSQPYFVCWDIICGTRAEPTKTAQERLEGRQKKE